MFRVQNDDLNAFIILRTVNKQIFSGPPRPAGTPPKEGNHSPPSEGQGWFKISPYWRCTVYSRNTTKTRGEISRIKRLPIRLAGRGDQKRITTRMTWQTCLDCRFLEKNINVPRNWRLRGAIGRYFGKTYLDARGRPR